MKKRIQHFLFVASLFFGGMAYAQQQGEGGTPLSFKLDATNAEVTFATMPGYNQDSIEAVVAAMDAVKGAYKFGYNYYTNYTLNNSGTWRNFPDGSRLWRLGVRCPGALTVNLGFNAVHIPDGAQLFVYSEDHKQVLGAFTSKYNFADQMLGTELIAGESVIVEYYEPAHVTDQATLNLFRITHGFRGTAPFVENISRAFGDAGPCNNNVNCPGGAAWSDQKRSVVCLVSGGSEFCSGALINNTCNNGTPYILTANHCGTADGTWVFRFNWEGPSCADPSSNPASVSISGGVTRANNANSDVHLCEMNSVPPANYNVYYAGWNRTANPVDSATCIHHPQGDIKKISWAQNPTISSPYAGADCWRVGQWTSGVTEPGSSGSPLFDNNHRIIGQLFGGPSACGQPAANLNDFYGKFGVSWNFGTTAATRLMDWLDPCNIDPQTLDGYDPNQPTQALDAQMSTVVSPAGNFTLCTGTISQNVTVILRNAGMDTLTSCTINWQIDTNAPTTFNWTGSLPATATTTVVLGNITLSSGTHTVTIVVSNPNNATDGNANNNVASATYNLTMIPTAAPPLVEGFQTATFPPTGWTLSNPSNPTWEANATVGSASSACMDIDNFNNDTRGSSDDLRTMNIDLTNALSAGLTFDVAYARYDATFSDTLGVYVSTDCGTTWSQIYLKAGTVLATAPDNTNQFIPTANQWRNEVVNMNTYIGQSSVMVAFRNQGGYGNFLYVDNINITMTTDVNEAQAGNWQVFPNPSQDGLFTLDFSAMNVNQMQYEVVNVLGEVVAAGTQKQPVRTAIDLSGLAQGTYFLRVTTSQGTSTKKVSIAR